MVSGYPTFTSIPRVDRFSTDTNGFGASQLGIRAKVNDYLGSSVGVVISVVLIPASQLGIRAKVNNYLGSSGLGVHKFSPVQASHLGIRA